MEFTLELAQQILLYIATYLLGMAFAGSFLGRRWMGTVDVFLHRTFKLDVTIGKYLYWKHFCCIPNPPRPKNLRKPTALTDILFARLIE